MKSFASHLAPFPVELYEAAAHRTARQHHTRAVVHALVIGAGLRRWGVLVALGMGQIH